ncbi:MAG: nucleotidyltransferase domain-containing protein [Candidatus Latescibacteria bacterium]|nr:nucleotidyltransferase domain-containing protein [Candidatus Latescibacterota bacterium]
MPSFDTLKTLTTTQRQALQAVARRLQAEFELEALILYGSVIRGEADEESDLDVLVLTTTPLPRSVRHRITDIVFEINLQYGTNISTVVVDRVTWESGPFSVLPIHDTILAEGIRFSPVPD